MTQARRRAYDALVLDVDGTLLDDDRQIPEHVRATLARARAAGVVVMLATGRSTLGCRPVSLSLGLDTPAIVYNGAAAYDAVHDRVIEQRTLPRRTVVRLLDRFADEALTVVSRPDGQFCGSPRTSHERRILADYRNLKRAQFGTFPVEGVFRVTLLSENHAAGALLTDVRRALDTPAYLTHFRLNLLSQFRDSHMHVVDVQPDCRGKAEAMRVLQERHGIPTERVVAVGDADNDIPMLHAAGLGVAMGNATPDARAAADRVIGRNTEGALAGLVEELFLG
ncbi:MAG: HAD family hydrolase [Myxococcales bacterium]|jgi:Cof subfamily protein (haloacid dehalogenase superfamily)